MRAVITTLAVLLAVTACGGDDKQSTTEATPSATWRRASRRGPAGQLARTMTSAHRVTWRRASSPGCRGADRSASRRAGLGQFAAEHVAGNSMVQESRSVRKPDGSIRECPRKERVHAAARPLLRSEGRSWLNGPMSTSRRTEGLRARSTPGGPSGSQTRTRRVDFQTARSSAREALDDLNPAAVAEVARTPDAGDNVASVEIAVAVASTTAPRMASNRLAGHAPWTPNPLLWSALPRQDREDSKNTRSTSAAQSGAMAKCTLMPQTACPHSWTDAPTRPDLVSATVSPNQRRFGDLPARWEIVGDGCTQRPLTVQLG